VEVHIDKEALVLNVLLKDGYFSRPNSRLSKATWIGVVSVEVLGGGVEPVVTQRDPIWVQNGNYLENEVLSQDLSL